MTEVANSRGAVVLVLGDLAAYFFSLILALLIRYSALPDRELVVLHLRSFGLLFVVFLLVSFSAGLYDRQTIANRSRFPGPLLGAQAANVLSSIAFFYLAPATITPKAVLAIYFIVSTVILIAWRAFMYPVFSAVRKQAAVLAGVGRDIEDLAAEIDGEPRYGLAFNGRVAPGVSAAETAKLVSAAVAETGATVVVADFHQPAIEAAMPYFYSLIFRGLQVIDASRLYETVFGRVPLSLVGERWLVEHSATALGSRRVYDALKRAMDVAAAVILGIIPILLCPFVWLAVKLEDGGPLFVIQQRVGRNGRPIRIAKFRSMTADDGGVYHDGGKTRLRVTRVGRFLRLTRIDELPQLWSVLMGDQSLIGPRPELPSLAAIYEKEIPYYNARHLIKPGLSGWAQIYHRAHPHHAVSVDETREKLSYDLYYVRRRSFMLDLRIALQTLKSILSRQGV